jgi:ribosomal protein S12 methylthiotransferase
MIKINVITLGCSKNIVDSEILIRQLQLNNFNVIYEGNIKKSDIVIINTCGFINDAKQESIDTILNCIDLKTKGIIKKIFVTGCLSERYKEQLFKELPEVDYFTGVYQLKELLNQIGGNYHEEIKNYRTLTTPSHYAYLKIAEGCNRKCSFCIIPQIKGKYISRNIESILEEAKFLTENGVKEIILIAQDTTYYGLDLYKKQKINTLLEELSKIKKLEWIRLHYTYPMGFPYEILETIKNSSKICKYLDIPFQHISDKILKSMNRGISKIETYNIIQNIRKTIPDIALRTTLITGYPNETEEDFNELKEFVKETAFERLGVFKYSHEEGTKAYKLKDNIPEAIKEQRVEEIMHIQENISLTNNKKLIGKTMKIILDREEKDYYIGRSEYDSPEIDNEVMIKKPIKSLPIGKFLNIKITDADYFDISGEIV